MCNLNNDFINYGFNCGCGCGCCSGFINDWRWGWNIDPWCFQRCNPCPPPCPPRRCCKVKCCRRRRCC